MSNSETKDKPVPNPRKGGVYRLTKDKLVQTQGPAVERKKAEVKTDTQKPKPASEPISELDATRAKEPTSDPAATSASKKKD